MYKILLAIFLISVSFQGVARETDANGIVEHAEAIAPLLPGMTLKNTCLEDSNKQRICTDTLLSDKPTVLIVYRGGWCPYCSAQLNRIQKIESSLKSMGYQLIAVSPDSNKSTSTLQKSGAVSYQLLTDNKMALSKSLGLAYFLDKKTEAIYRDKLGVPFIDTNGDPRVSLPVPAVYILDKNATVHFQYVNPNFRLRLNEKVLLVAAEEAIKSMK